MFGSQQPINTLDASVQDINLANISEAPQDSICCIAWIPQA
jgi:hypothetical protein